MSDLDKGQHGRVPIVLQCSLTDVQYLAYIPIEDHCNRRFNYQMQLNWFRRAFDKKAAQELGSLVSYEVCY